MTASSKRAASQDSEDPTPKRLKPESMQKSSRADESLSGGVQPSRHILDDYDFYKLRRELYLLELHDADGSPIPRLDPSQKLPADLLDWTQWIVPKYDARVGGGGYGDVFKGQWKGIAGLYKDIPKVVIKVMRVERDTQQNASRRYQQVRREITVWNAVDHEHIVPFLGICNVDDNLPGLISLYMENGDVKCYLKNNPHGDRYILMIGIALGLEFLHNFKPTIIHGDIKAANVLVNRHGQACLVDFGISSMVAENTTLWVTSATHAQGTTRWQAPELFESKASTASDVYAWAMTCLEIMTGRLPFSECPNDGAVVLALMKGRIPERPSTSIIEDHIWDILVSCWIHSPLSRPPMTDIVRKSIVLMAQSVNACDLYGRSTLSLWAGRELQRCYRLTWNPAQASATLLQAWDRLDPALAIQWLLEVKCIDTNSKDERNWSALMYAVKAGFRDAVAMFIDRPECALSLKKQSLLLAAAEGREEIVHILLTSISPSSQYKRGSGSITSDVLSTQEHQQTDASQDSTYRPIPTAIPQIMTMLADGEHRYLALDVLVKLSEHDIYQYGISQEIPQLATMLTNEDKDIRCSVLDALVKLSKHLSDVYRNTIIIPQIIIMLGGGDKDIRYSALDALVKLSEHDNYRIAIIREIPQITAMLTIDDRGVVYSALDALVKLSEHDIYRNAIKPVTPQIVTMLDDEDRDVRYSALNALVKVLEHDIYQKSITPATPQIITMLGDEVWGVRYSALNALMKLSEYDIYRNSVTLAIPQIITMIGDENWNIRYSALHAIVKLSEHDIYRNAIAAELPRITAMLMNEDRDVRNSALNAILKLSEHDIYRNAIKPSTPQIVTMLDADDWDVRCSALNALVKLLEHDIYQKSITPAIPQIIPMLREEDRRVRNSALNALVELSGHDIYWNAVTTATPRILTMIGDENWNIRYSALHAIVKLSEHDIYRNAIAAELPRITAMLMNEDRDVRNSALNALVKLSKHNSYRNSIAATIPQMLTILTDVTRTAEAATLNALLAKLSDHEAFDDSTLALYYSNENNNSEK